MDYYYKQIDPTLPKLSRGTSDSVGVDTYIRVDTPVCPGCWAKVPLNVVIKPPIGCFVGVVPRSSTFQKTGLICPGSIGIIDPDYCGNADEVSAIVYNTRETMVYAKRGARLFQLVLFKYSDESPIEREGLYREGNRGGYGSTD